MEVDMSNTKELIFNEFNGTEEKASIHSHAYRDTDIVIRALGTDKVLFRGKNKIVLPGAEFTARAHFGFAPTTEITPSYNTELGLENSVFEVPAEPEKVMLFCVGTDGCGRENSQVREVNYAKWITPEALVPFRYPLVTEDISDAKKMTYHGRKVIGNRVAYYFKTFETEPVLIRRFEDGTPIDAKIYNTNKNLDVETVVEIHLKITEDECREFFVNTVGLNEARINTISLCYAWRKEIDGVMHYQDIRPLTKLNFPNEQLIELNKGIDITYQIYY